MPQTTLQEAVRGDPASERALRVVEGPARAPWRWAAVPLGVAYVVLLAAQFHAVISAANLDADTVSAPVIGQLFGTAPAHAHVVLGEFGWYSTLLFLLATKWLPMHRQLWEAAPYALALAGIALASWSVWQVAGRFAASLTAVLLVCAAPPTLHLLLSMTQHAPDWFCCSLLAAFGVLLERRAATLRWPVLGLLAALVAVLVGVNAASDPLVVIAGLGPFALALVAGSRLVRGPHSKRMAATGVATLLLTGACWAITASVMSSWNVAPEQGLHTTTLASTSQLSTNFKLWWQSIAVLGNGDFFGHRLSFITCLAVACAVLSLLAFVLVARAGWTEPRRALRVGALPTGPRGERRVPGRLSFMVFWCSSAILLSGAFLFSSTPVDIHSDRYLVGLVYAIAAVIPVLAAGRLAREAVALAATCVFALAGVISVAQGNDRRNTGGFPSAQEASQIARIAAADHLRYGYSGYWDAAPITWATNFRIQVYPVSVCDRGEHLCRFDLHYISSWYSPHRTAGSFLLADPGLALVSGPTPDLGPPAAIHRIGGITMYVYRYDLATRILAHT